MQFYNFINVVDFQEKLLKMEETKCVKLKYENGPQNEFINSSNCKINIYVNKLKITNIYVLKSSELTVNK